jgi:hypothetical protein
MLKIERKFEVITETKRRFVIRQFPTSKQTACAECGETMLAIEQTAKLLHLKQRRIFQIIEIGAVHFAEAEAGRLMVCPTSLTKFLDCES